MITTCTWLGRGPHRCPKRAIVRSITTWPNA